MRLVPRFALGIATVALVIGSCLPSAFAQTDEELRQLYFRRDFQRMEEIARTGDTRAEAWMGLITNNQHRRSEAKEWYLRAAEKNNLFAIGRLVAMYHFDREFVEAARWYRRGAELGDEYNQYVYARMLLQGRGIPADENEAFRWFSAAAGSGHAYSNLELARIYFRGIGIPRDPVQAYAYLEVALTALRPSNVPAIDEARALRNDIEGLLSQQQIEEARRRARALTPAYVRP
jgi:TPR repeat protein